MRKHAWLFLLFLTASAAHAEDPVCLNPPDDSPMADLPARYVIPKFRIGARNQFLDGALYDDKGQILCVLKHAPGAYVYTGTLPVGPMTEAFCAQVSQDLAAGKPTDMVALGLSNNDLLRRVIWLYGEGGCNPVAVACAPTAKDCGPAPQGQYGSLYYAYAIKALRKSFHSDEQMLHIAASDSTGSLFDSYFVTGANNNTRTIISASKNPQLWGPNPLPVDATSCQFNDLCWAQQHISRCLQDVIHAERDTDNKDTPFAKPLDQWLGEVGPKDVNHGKVCFKSMPRILVHSRTGKPFLECFHSM